MEGLIFSVISLLVLFPILYFLRIGISVRGKLALTGAAFCIAGLGLLSNAIFPFWQTVIIELLVIGIISYFIHNKLGSTLYAAEENDVELVEEAETKLAVEGYSDSYSYIAHSDKLINDKDYEVEERVKQLFTKKTVLQNSEEIDRFPTEEDNLLEDSMPVNINNQVEEAVEDYNLEELLEEEGEVSSEEESIEDFAFDQIGLNEAAASLDVTEEDDHEFEDEGELQILSFGAIPTNKSKNKPDKENELDIDLEEIEFFNKNFDQAPVNEQQQEEVLDNRETLTRMLERAGFPRKS